MRPGARRGSWHGNGANPLPTLPSSPNQCTGAIFHYLARTEFCVGWLEETSKSPASKKTNGRKEGDERKKVGSPRTPDNATDYLPLRGLPVLTPGTESEKGSGRLSSRNEMRQFFEIMAPGPRSKRTKRSAPKRRNDNFPSRPRKTTLSLT